MIILISGSINSGKSTVARLLAEKLPNVALVEIDRLHEFVGWMPINEAVQINLENAASIIRNFVHSGLDVVVPYPLSRKNHDMLMGSLGSLQQKIHIFTLSPLLDIALSDRGSRKLTESERQRIRYHYEIGINKPDFGMIIDTSHQTPEETVSVILDSSK